MARSTRRSRRSSSGAFDYLTKPFDKDEVRQVVAKALKTRALAQEEATHRADGLSHLGWRALRHHR